MVWKGSGSVSGMPAVTQHHGSGEKRVAVGRVRPYDELFSELGLPSAWPLPRTSAAASPLPAPNPTLSLTCDDRRRRARARAIWGWFSQCSHLHYGTRKLHERPSPHTPPRLERVGNPRLCLAELLPGCLKRRAIHNSRPNRVPVTPGTRTPTFASNCRRCAHKCNVVL